MGIKTVANHVGMSYTYLSKIENGYKAPSRELVMKLCTLYDADPDEIVAQLGMLPADIQDIIRQNGKQVFDLLRARYRGRDDGAEDVE
ncbi:MAG: helix-turn-helix transcriptional regulator [Phycisphaerae bacterium]|nr:helix-turn-helix transcriptional regulator [Phycisphaerae bacterium]